MSAWYIFLTWNWTGLSSLLSMEIRILARLGSVTLSMIMPSTSMFWRPPSRPATNDIFSDSFKWTLRSREWKIIQVKVKGWSRDDSTKGMRIRGVELYTIGIPYSLNVLRLENFMGQRTATKFSTVKYQVHNRCKAWLEARSCKFYPVWAEFGKTAKYSPLEILGYTVIRYMLHPRETRGLTG